MSIQTAPQASRTDQLARSLAAMRDRIAAECRRLGRDPGSVTLITVTKNFPVSDAVALARLGALDLGENRDQEASDKAGHWPADAPRPRWHFIGQLQRNKAASVARYATAVHSVDRLGLVTALARGAERAGRTLDCLVQVDLDAGREHVGPTGRRGGAAPDEVEALAEAIDRAEGLRLAGVMAVAPHGAATPSGVADDEGLIRDGFERLAGVSAALRSARPGASAISAGMSADWPLALEYGATHLRIGSAILGSRAPIG